MDIREKVGNRIRDGRKLRNRTLIQLAEACDSSEAHLSKVERGERQIGLLLLEKIAKSLNVSMVYFFEEEE